MPLAKVAMLALAIFLLTGAAPAQDKVVIRVDPEEPPVVRTGKIINISRKVGEILLKDISEAVIHIPLEQVESIETVNEKLLEDWREIQETREVSGTVGADEREFGERGDGSVDVESVDLLPDPQTAEEVRKLLARLEQDPGAESAIVEIGRMATPLILEELSNQTDEVRMAACRMLGRIGDTRDTVREKLIERVEDECAGVRCEAVQALGRIDPEDRKVWEAMVNRARVEKVTEVMRALITCLVEVARHNQTAYRHLHEDVYKAEDSVVVYYYAGQALLGNKKVVGKLTQYLTASLKDRAWFAEALAQVDREGALRFLVEQLQVTGGDFAQEWEIIEVLRRLTGKEFGYNPNGSRMARQRAVDSWVTWWNRGGERPDEPGSGR